MIKNVIFDLGKVLINNCPNEYLRKYGYDEEKYQALLDAIVNDSLWHDMDIGKYESCTEMVEEYVEKHKTLETEIRLFFSENWMEFYAPYEDTLLFYNELYKQGYSIYILSNYAKDGFDLIHKKYDFFKKAKGIVVSSYVGMTKPDLRIYEYLLETYNLNPDECVFIDDSVANIKAANELGIHGIIYTDIDSLRKDFKMITETER